MSRVSRIGAWACTLLLLAATSASAVPIVYNPQLDPGQPRLGVQTQPNGNQSNPVGAQYFFFAANAGASVNVQAIRGDINYDPAMWVFSGLFSDTNQFGASFDTGDPGFIDFADDEIANPGPFGDPLASFTAPTTGFYTVAVTNFLSSGSPPFPFTITATGILPSPEPVSMVAFALAGVAGVVYVRRRKQVAVA